MADIVSPEIYMSHHFIFQKNYYCSVTDMEDVPVPYDD